MQGGVGRGSVSVSRGAFMGKCAEFAVIAALTAIVAGAAAAQERAQVGQLTCDISGGVGLIFGSQRTLNCTFSPSVPGPVEFYAGTLTKLGVDIGVTAGGGMVWLVYAPPSPSAGALSRGYRRPPPPAPPGARPPADEPSCVAH